MELVPVAFASLLVALAGPLGITLGWWLGRRGERERQMREERKGAYLAFVRAVMRYRNAPDDERRAIREERWAALAEIVLVAPPAVVEAAAYQVSTGDRLLDPDVTADERRSVFEALWQRNSVFTRLARSDLRVGAVDPFAGIEPVVGDHIDFRPPTTVARAGSTPSRE